jgi:hypothetical protein
MKNWERLPRGTPSTRFETHSDNVDLTTISGNVICFEIAAEDRRLMNAERG